MYFCADVSIGHYSLSHSVIVTMYGVLLDSIFEVMRSQFDAEQWAEIQRLSGYIRDSEINEFRSYSDSLIPRLTSAAHLVAGISPGQVFAFMKYGITNHMYRSPFFHVFVYNVA